jgi:hypothetical protein
MMGMTASYERGVARPRGFDAGLQAFGKSFP